MNYSVITFMQPGDWFVFSAVYGTMQACMLLALIVILTHARGRDL